jgi:aminoglycoside 3-N-acetyltransferase
MNQDAAQIAGQLADLGVKKAGFLLVHASLKSLGMVSGGPETVIEGLREALGSEGTLLMPALSYESVKKEHPIFSVLDTPCCVGALPEFFRRRVGTTRSVHPTHSVCGVGPGAGGMLDGHYLDVTPCGVNSPFHRLREKAGQILFIGCGLKPNTSMHAVEELVEPPYLYAEYVDYRVTLADDREIAMRVRSHGFKGWQQCYDRIEDLLAGEGIRSGMVLSAKCYILEASAFWQKVHEKLKVAPLYFADRVPSSPHIRPNQ